MQMIYLFCSLRCDSLGRYVADFTVSLQLWLQLGRQALTDSAVEKTSISVEDNR
jgi:hypothetical protein